MTRRGPVVVFSVLIPALIAVVLLLSLGSCAARSDARRAALTIGEVALTIDQQERNAFAAKLYGAEKHQELGGHVLRILYGARAYERAVAAGQDPSVIRVDLLRALADLEQAAKGVDVIGDAVRAVRVLLGGTP